MEQEITREIINAKRRATKKPPKEEVEQMTFIEWANRNLGLVWHTPNARKYSRGSWEYWRRMGVCPGIPDVLILHNGKFLAIEFKRQDEKVRGDQSAVIDRMRRNGVPVIVAYSAKEAADFVKKNFGI